jgi:hypothetical protein
MRDGRVVDTYEGGTDGAVLMRDMTERKDSGR